MTKISLDDVLARLNGTEKSVVALGSTTSNGWLPTLAWNPNSSFTAGSEEAEGSKDRLENFIASEQKKGRLCVGYLSYDFGRLQHRVPSTIEDDLATPLVTVYSFDSWLTFENDVMTVHSHNPQFKKEVNAVLERQPRLLGDTVYSHPLSPHWSRESYKQAYKKVDDYIKAGDIYQVNLTHRLEGTTKLQGIDIYRKVVRSSRADFQAFIQGEGFEIISASPERFVKIQSGRIVTSPIKGTRPRGKDDHEDELLRQDLETNPKDNAELNMITDLMRNDLGVVSEVGSVHVTENRVLTAYPTLWHAHSTIEGVLRADVSPISALVSLMPGGSITGTPKKRAIEIIDELENHQRGLYTGSIFVIQPNGDLDSNIAIRTMVKKESDLYLSVGGGIVYDSTEADEYDESLQKAAVFTNL